MSSRPPCGSLLAPEQAKALGGVRFDETPNPKGDGLLYGVEGGVTPPHWERPDSPASGASPVEPATDE